MAYDNFYLEYLATEDRKRHWITNCITNGYLVIVIELSFAALIDDSGI